MNDDLSASASVPTTRRGVIAAASLLPFGGAALAASMKEKDVPRPSQTSPPGQVEPDYILNVVNN